LKVFRLGVQRALFAGQGQFFSLHSVKSDLHVAQNSPALLLVEASLLGLHFPLNKIAFGLGKGKILNARIGGFGRDRGDRP
jgi:hypothetical protein